MQSVLDDVQSDMENELDKVSLERLAEINPDLLEQIKTAAQASLPVASGVSTDTQQQQQEQQQQQQLPHFFTETRSPETLAQSKAWGEVKWDYLEETHAVITNLQYQVRKSASVEALYTQHEAIEMTQYLAAASATATLLTASLERIKEQQDRKDSKPNVAFPGSDGAVGTNRGFVIDKSKFSNDGIKRKDPAVIGLLYEVGLPFVSSADGRRFASQLELSNHLDALFKKNQIEKSMASTEERGWYNTDPVWTRQAKEEETENADDTPAISALAEEGESDSGTVPADETRDRCVICGINFKMFFDNDNGIYMYSNCREIEVLNDDAAEKESEECLVHATCWKGLGSPEVLTTDQTLQDTLPHY
jgi:pre-mRNA cleavage complex 2 protein Pcf11